MLKVHIIYVTLFEKDFLQKVCIVILREEINMAKINHSESPFFFNWQVYIFLEEGILYRS